jgi:hypothetical protein
LARNLNIGIGKSVIGEWDIGDWEIGKSVIGEWDIGDWEIGKSGTLKYKSPITNR